MKVLVTGGAGFIGSHLVEALLARGDTVTVLDDCSTGSVENAQLHDGHANFRFVQGTVLDRDLFEGLAANVDQIYHLAAAVGVRWVIENPLQSIITNVRGTEIVLESAARSGARVLIASTSEAYGKNDADMLSEDDDRILGSTKVTRWLYAATKSLDECLAFAYWQEQKLPVVIVRFFNTIGPRQTGRYGMVVPRFVEQALMNEPITVYGDGQQTRCFTDVRDVVRAITALMQAEQALGEVFNVGQSAEISIENLARRIRDLAESNSEISLVPYDQAFASGGFEDMRRRVPNVEKLRRVVGFSPAIPLDETLRHIVDERRAHMAARQRA
ncbi:MAG: NAD-dependent epimerase/dehydratase family protein [Chloroflexota bacterium]